MSRRPRRAGVLGVMIVVGVVTACAPAPTAPPKISTTPSTTAPATTAPAVKPITVVAAGDIACSAADKFFNGGAGDATHCQMEATSAQVARFAPAAVLALGDEQYDSATLAEFQGSYATTWGRFKAITHPVPGNHEYVTAHAGGYLAYFGAAAAPAGKTWYSFDLGSWHVVALDANCNQVGGCGASSPQGTWLAADLAKSTARCTMAFWHQPTFSSSTSRGVANTLPLWQAVVRGGADLVLNGHRHQYERFARMDATGAAAPTTGTREIVVGTGGEDLEPFGAIAPTSEAHSQTFGVLDLELAATSYSFRFVDVNGALLDHGAGTCRG